MDRPDTREWLTTNGLGGYASGTVCGANTRRYHGLLVAALEPPGRRTILLSRVDETVRAAGLPPSRPLPGGAGPELGVPGRERAVDQARRLPAHPERNGDRIPLGR